MAEQNLILSLPQGMTCATSLGIEGYAWHQSPGSGRHFIDRKVLFDLALENGRPSFEYMDEGGWRDAAGDTARALDAIAQGKRTKTALSNNAFSCTPLDAFRTGSLVKTGGAVLPLVAAGEVARFDPRAVCDEGMTPDQIAAAIGQPAQAARTPRLYMVLCPIEFIVLTNLTRREYAWYATHRPGKVFRQVAFTELASDQTHVAAQSIFENAREELKRTPSKKTKTIVIEDCINRVPFAAWLGYNGEAEGGLWVADRDHVKCWHFPKKIPAAWERAED